MFSAIAAFFWGASTAATPSPAPTPTPSPAPGHEEPLPAGVNSIKDDVFSDAITHEGVDDVAPAAVESIFSTSSLSDEEAGWVFVNNNKRGNTTSVGKETCPKGMNPFFDDSRTRLPDFINGIILKCSAASNNPEETQAVEPIEVDPVLEHEDIKSPPVKNNKNNKNQNNNNNNVPATRSKNIPNSALHASSVLSAIEELRPQQKSQRRQRERHLKRKQLERANKATHVESSSNQPAKRRAMYNSAVFSRAVNNRKC